MNFVPNNETLPVNKTLKGVRLDGKNLVKEWHTTHEKDKYCFISKPSDLQNCDGSAKDYILGN